MSSLVCVDDNEEESSLLASDGHRPNFLREEGTRRSIDERLNSIRMVAMFRFKSLPFGSMRQHNCCFMNTAVPGFCQSTSSHETELSQMLQHSHSQSTSRVHGGYANDKLCKCVSMVQKNLLSQLQTPNALLSRSSTHPC